MTTLKFRAWDTEEKRWLDLTDFGVCNCGNIMLRQSGSMNYSACTATSRYIITQSTGLLDEAGREIYIGDILWDENWGYDPKTGKRVVAEVAYERAGLLFIGGKTPEYKWGNYVNHPCKIVGNIYESTELRRGEFIVIS